ncbi:MAG TPA: hypothetical protein VF471_05985 [Pseudoxanthomonas sp.]
MRELKAEEFDQVGGGIYPILVVAASLFVFGYSIGKDMAERDNAKQS